MDSSADANVNPWVEREEERQREAWARFWRDARAATDPLYQAEMRAMAALEPVAPKEPTPE